MMCKLSLSSQFIIISIIRSRAMRRGLWYCPAYILALVIQDTTQSSRFCSFFGEARLSHESYHPVLEFIFLLHTRRKRKKQRERPKKEGKEAKFYPSRVPKREES